MLNMQDALLPPSLPPIAPRRPLCCSCSFGTPRPAPEFESRGERKNVSRRSLSRTSGPACLPSTRLPPADSATQPAFAVRQNTHAQHSTAQQRPRARSLRHTTQQHSNRRKAAQCRRARWVGWGGWAGGGGVRAVPGTSHRCLYTGRWSFFLFAPPACTPLCSTTQAAIVRTAALDGRARRCVCVGRWDRRRRSSPAM